MSPRLVFEKIDADFREHKAKWFNESTGYLANRVASDYFYRVSGSLVVLALPC